MLQRMKRIENITSVQNPKIKALLSLEEKSSKRREKGLFIVEGKRELEHCTRAGFIPEAVFVCREIISDAYLKIISLKVEKANPECQIIEVSPYVYNKIAYRGSTEGIIAEIKNKSFSLEEIKLGKCPLVMVLESVEKPGNLGAVLRSADAAGADAVVICDPLTDLFNPNLIRASIGAVFSRQIALATSQDTIKWLKNNNIKIYTAQLQDSSAYYNTDMTGPTAIVMGTESTGLTEQWRKAADKHILIPMSGALDSLNVSVSAAILMFEAVRQRDQHQTTE